MEPSNRRSFQLRIVVMAVVAGIVSAVASIVTLWWLELNVHPALMGGIVGAVVGSLVPTVIRREPSV